MGDAKRRKAEITMLKASGKPKRDTNEIIPNWTFGMLMWEKQHIESMSATEQNRVFSATKKLAKFLGTRPESYNWSQTFGTSCDNEIGIYFPEENLVYQVRGTCLGDLYDGYFIEYDNNRHMGCPGVIAVIDYKLSGKPNQQEWLKDLMSVDISDMRVLLPA